MSCGSASPPPRSQALCSSPALAPNLLALEIVRRTVNIEIDWLSWFAAIAPVGILLLLALPLLTYWIYPPGIKRSEEVRQWADRELAGMGPMSAREMTLPSS